jgi:hypothetical protein
VGKANGSRECVPDDRLRVLTIAQHAPGQDGGHGPSAPLPTLRSYFGATYQDGVFVKQQG